MAVGLGLAGLYLLAAVVTLVLSDRPFRPLFDGLTPPMPYRWVNPPREVARDNQQPGSSSRELPFGPEGSPFVSVTPEDGQAILLLEAKAVPPHPPDTALAVSVTPVDALTLGPLPEKMSPQSNAYRLELSYRPSGPPVPATDLVAGVTTSISLVGAGGSDALLFSPDGQAWEPRPTMPLGFGHGLETPFVGPGYYLVTDIDDTAGGGGSSPVVVGLVLLGPPLLVGGLVLRNRRAKAQARARIEAAAAKRRAQQPRGGRKSKRPRR